MTDDPFIQPRMFPPPERNVTLPTNPPIKLRLQSMSYEPLFAGHAVALRAHISCDDAKMQPACHALGEAIQKELERFCHTQAEKSGFMDDKGCYTKLANTENGAQVDLTAVDSKTYGFTFHTIRTARAEQESKILLGVAEQFIATNQEEWKNAIQEGAPLVSQSGPDMHWSDIVKRYASDAEKGSPASKAKPSLA